LIETAKLKVVPQIECVPPREETTKEKSRKEERDFQVRIANGVKEVEEQPVCRYDILKIDVSLTQTNVNGSKRSRIDGDGLCNESKNTKFFTTFAHHGDLPSRYFYRVGRWVRSSARS
jgi:hypothetical protein